MNSSNWVKPNDLMKARKLKAKRNALKARLRNCHPTEPENHLLIEEGASPSDITKRKRRNPFECPQTKNGSVTTKLSLEISSPESPFLKFLSSDGKITAVHDEFSKYLKLLPETYTYVRDTSQKSWTKSLTIDWSLKSQLRFCSSKRLQWRHTFKTSEEASGTTGFVRCLNSETESRDGRTLDTSANAQFYQCCLLWQHPNLPVVKLFPRNQEKISVQTGFFGSDQKVVSCLHNEWSESLRSLYQLLRVRQCPFFYVCGHSFTCLFRAAGAAGFPHTHALLTPTTRGFRTALKNEGIEFSMPLYKASQKETEDIQDQSEKDEAEEEPSDFLETLGLETSQFPSLNQSRVMTENKKFQNIDSSPQSLVYVEDMELQGLINFLLNCGSCVSTTGPLAGVPPTLLSPVAFHGGTLKSLKVNGGNIRTQNGETLFCIDIQGPILPTTVLHLSSLLSSSTEAFSLSLSTLPSTLPFSSVFSSVTGSSMSMAFASEGLVDCGLDSELREVLCQSLDRLADIGLKSSYKEVIFENGLFTWS